MRSILIWLTVLFAVFGPKVGGVADVAVLASGTGLLALIDQRRLAISSTLLLVIALVALLTVVAGG